MERGNTRVQSRQRLEFFVSMGTAALIIYVFKVPVFWAFFLTTLAVAGPFWRRYCDVADDIDDTHRLVASVVTCFTTVRMDEKHDFNFVMDVLAEELRHDLESQRPTRK
jgi:hypothetical protein